MMSHHQQHLSGTWWRGAANSLHSKRVEGGREGGSEKEGERGTGGI